MVRADRTLAIRLSDYAQTAPVMLADRQDDVLHALRRVRARYVVTCTPRRPDDRLPYLLTEEMLATERLMEARPDLFAHRGAFPLLIEFERPGWNWALHVWEYRGDLPSGPGEYSVVIPTADLTLTPGAFGGSGGNPAPKQPDRTGVEPVERVQP
jgi:hypothetical protein